MHFFLGALRVNYYFITVHTYLATMTAPVEDRQQYEANLLSETAGFAGCEIVRRYLLFVLCHVLPSDMIQ